MTTPHPTSQPLQGPGTTRVQLALVTFMPVLFVVLIALMYVVAQPVAP